MKITNLLEFSHRAQLRKWFEQHAATDKECWIAMYRVKRPADCGDCLPYIDVVEEALCFGWIDSTLKRLPDGRLRNACLHAANAATGQNSTNNAVPISKPAD